MRGLPEREKDLPMSSKDEVAIELKEVSKTYLLYPSPASRLKQFLFRGLKNYYRAAHALKPVSLTLNKGETVGIVGRNGSGKSTLLQIICGTLAPTSGEVKVSGRIAALLELGAGFNMEFTGRENMYLNGSLLGLSRAEIDAKADYIERFAGISHFMDQPVKTYSSGMVVRLAFAIATAVVPETLIIDEALAVGDEAFQRKCYARLRELQDAGTTILFVSHSAQSVVDLCSRAILLDAGEMLLEAAPKEVIAAYQRLIYSEQDQQERIRQEIKVSKSTTASLQPVQSSQGAFPKSPESRTEYTPHGGRIQNPRLTDEAGAPAYLLKAGQHYLYQYEVTFEESKKQVWFGMMIKTPTGFELSGASGAGDKLLLEEVKAGQRMQVTFRFRCPMFTGTYYMNCGCSHFTSDGQEAFIHRIIDAIQFKVIQDANKGSVRTIQHNGIVDADTCCKVQVM